MIAPQRERIHSRWRHIMADVNLQRRGQPIRRVVFKRPRWSKGLVHLVAHLSFDGRVDRYGCAYYSREKAQVKHVQKLLLDLLGIKARVRQRSNGIWLLSYYNVKVAEWLKAFFDDEGHVHFTGVIRRVRASQKNLEILQYARRFLAFKDIGSRIDHRAHAVEITGRANLLKFSRRINFSKELHINGARKNGRWQNSIEKRKLLDYALSSYQ